jgi:hypothetical protein
MDAKGPQTHSIPALLNPVGDSARTLQPNPILRPELSINVLNRVARPSATPTRHGACSRPKQGGGYDRVCSTHTLEIDKADFLRPDYC